MSTEIPGKIPENPYANIAQRIQGLDGIQLPDLIREVTEFINQPQLAAPPIEKAPAKSNATESLPIPKALINDASQLSRLAQKSGLSVPDVTGRMADMFQTGPHPSETNANTALKEILDTGKKGDSLSWVVLTHFKDHQPVPLAVPSPVRLPPERLTPAVPRHFPRPAPELVPHTAPETQPASAPPETDQKIITQTREDLQIEWRPDIQVQPEIQVGNVEVTSVQVTQYDRSGNPEFKTDPKLIHLRGSGRIIDFLNNLFSQACVLGVKAESDFELAQRLHESSDPTSTVRARGSRSMVTLAEQAASTSLELTTAAAELALQYAYNGQISMTPYEALTMVETSRNAFDTVPIFDKLPGSLVDRFTKWRR
jgi:hypothetical protein